MEGMQLLEWLYAHRISVWSILQQEKSFRKVADPISKVESEKASYNGAGNSDFKEAYVCKSECFSQKWSHCSLAKAPFLKAWRVRLYFES